MVSPLEGAVAVITGGAGRIGSALARRCAEEGARAVVVADKDQAGAAEVATALPGADHLAIRLDVTVESEVRGAVEWVEQRLGSIDLWCSTAEVVGGTGLGSDADWERAWKLHVMAQVFAARAVLPGMVERHRGHLLITASAAGLLTEPATAPYPVTKHAAVALAEWLAIEYGGTGVTVSCLCPPFSLTPAPAGAATAESGTDPMDPDDIAEAVVKALPEEHFLILPDPRVASYEQSRLGDRDRWLAGMRRLADRIGTRRAGRAARR